MSLMAKSDFTIIGWTGPRHLAIKVRSGGADYYVPPDIGNVDYQEILESGAPIPNAYDQAATLLPVIPKQTLSSLL